ncbi:MAG TPA: DUF2865 domain-containing protein [Hyphomicrobiaceae bacterium]
MSSTVRPQRFAARATVPRSRRGARRAGAAPFVLAALATLAVAGTCAAHYGAGPTAAAATATVPRWEQTPGGGAAPVHDRARRLRLAQTGGNPFFSFLNSLFGPPPSEPRRQRRIERPPRAPPPAAPEAPPPDPPGARPEEVPTYRTMCVRLCDGYYWPVSFATSRDNFARDAQSCLKSCGASTALYYYPNPGGAPDDMVSLQGHPYKSLGTAFVYRTTYDPGCKCRPHPWERAAIERHKAYAAQSQGRTLAQRTRRAR